MAGRDERDPVHLVGEEAVGDALGPGDGFVADLGREGESFGHVRFLSPTSREAPFSSLL